MAKILMAKLKMFQMILFQQIPTESSPESVWFIKVKESFESAVEMIDEYENLTAPTLLYIEGKFMEKVDALAKGFLYKLFKKKTFL